MNHLYRELAPICERGWKRIDDEARDMLSTALAGRKLVDLAGPLGWQTSSVCQGRANASSRPLAAGVETRIREVRPLIELRVPFQVKRRELDAISRGATDPDLEAVSRAARVAALAEDTFIFHGFSETASPGMVSDADAHVKMDPDFDYVDFPDKVVEALAKLRLRGIEGPYALALGPRCYEGVTSTTHSGGYPILDHLRSFVDGPLIWAPALNGSMVVSLRGGDFLLTLGSDLSIGYLAHDAENVSLYIEESLAFENFEPAAAVPLFYASADAKIGKNGGK